MKLAPVPSALTNDRERNIISSQKLTENAVVPGEDCVQNSCVNLTKPGLHLGAGRTPRPAPHFLNCDLYEGDNIDLAFDLLCPWPIESNSISEIYASHTLEHLPDHRFFFREAWRVLAPDGKMTLRVPYGNHRSAWYDPEHVRPWWPESFASLQPGYNAAISNPQYDAWDAPFLVAQVGERISGGWAKWLRPWWLRKRLLPWLDKLPDAVEELWVEAYALKTSEAVAYCRATRAANAVPVRMLMHAHQWKTNHPSTEFGVLDITYKTVTRAF